MELKDTIPMMTDPDYKERFRAEYFQLKIRAEKLGAMLEKMAGGQLEFEPKCSFELLSEQHQLMWNLISLMAKRAEIEGIDLAE